MFTTAEKPKDKEKKERTVRTPQQRVADLDEKIRDKEKEVADLRAKRRDLVAKFKKRAEMFTQFVDAPEASS